MFYKERKRQLALLVGVLTMVSAAVAVQPQFAVDITSAGMYLEMCRNALNGNMPDDAQWDSLFASPAYSMAIAQSGWDKAEFTGNVRRGFEIAFDADNSDYEATPQALERLDDMTCRYVKGELGDEDYIMGAFGLVGYGGHTSGDYMVFLIRDYLGNEAVLESVGDVEAFVDNYNKAAAKAGKYVFSDTFTQHIRNLFKDKKR